MDGEAVHYSHTRAIVTTLEGVRSPSVLRTVALLRVPCEYYRVPCEYYMTLEGVRSSAAHCGALLLCGSIRDDLRRRTGLDAAGQLAPGPHNLTLVRYAAEGQVPARALLGAVQCSSRLPTSLWRR